MGYWLAGFEVIGVDIRPQPNYPFEFIQADALAPPVRLSAFSVVHASPPCPRWSRVSHVTRAQAKHPDLLGPVRELLRAAGVPYVIENVPGAPMRDYITLCGTAFGLGAGPWELWRHRQFESNVTWPALLPPCGHRVRAMVAGVYGGGGYRAISDRHAGKNSDKSVRAAVMGIDWMSRRELAQALPPAYTEWIGNHLLQALV